MSAKPNIITTVMLYNNTVQFVLCNSIALDVKLYKMCLWRFQAHNDDFSSLVLSILRCHLSDVILNLFCSFVTVILTYRQLRQMHIYGVVLIGIITIPHNIITSEAPSKTAGMVMMGMVMMKRTLKFYCIKLHKLMLHFMLFLGLILPGES